MECFSKIQSVLVPRIEIVATVIDFCFS